ncbi:MAG: phosphoesterase [Planctomycetia bacterium]|nr:phosphoesterase [Planctomycetia bacterium]
MASIPQEDVLVVPRSLFEAVGAFQGFRGDVGGYLPALLDPRHTSWRPRAAVEDDPSFKQLIPYCVLAHRGPDAAIRYFAYTRGGGQGDARLRAKRSVGIGGHIASCDGAHGDDTSYEAGMRRELAEEIAIEGGWTSRCVGLINDDSNAVGSVHLGVVHVLELERPDVSARESAVVDCGFETLAALLEARDRFETWSQIALDALRDGTIAV